MPREVDGLLDTIDELVDEALAAGPVDDYNTNRYDKCWHCDRDWHGIPITERIEQMRWSGRFDEGYRLAEDDSPIVCPGSDFIGPVRARISRTQADIFARASESLLSTLSLASRQPPWSDARWWKTVLPADGQCLYDTVESRVTIRIGGPGGPEVTVNAEHFRALHEDNIEDIYAEATRTRPGRIIVHVLADTAPRIGGTWTPITAPGVTAHPSDYPRRPTLRRDLNFSFNVNIALVEWNWDEPDGVERSDSDPEATRYATVDDIAGRRLANPDDGTWRHIEYGRPVWIRYWDRDFNLITTEGQPSPPTPAESSPVRSDAGIPTARLRERRQLRARTQQQSQAAQARQELIDRLRSLALPHTTRETP